MIAAILNGWMRHLAILVPVQGPLSSLAFGVANETAKLDTKLLLATGSSYFSANPSLYVRTGALCICQVFCRCKRH